LALLSSFLAVLSATAIGCSGRSGIAVGIGGCVVVVIGHTVAVRVILLLLQLILHARMGSRLLPTTVPTMRRPVRLLAFHAAVGRVPGEAINTVSSPEFLKENANQQQW